METQRAVVSGEILRESVKIFKLLAWHIRPLQMITLM
jgi:hypothetical protein